MRQPSRSHPVAFALLIGTLFTFLAGGMYATGLLVRLDRYGLDVLFRQLSPVPVDERIVLIDINDPALAEMPEWPWPRRRMAQIVSTLDELGAQVIGMDILFADASSPRLGGFDRAGAKRIDGHDSTQPDLHAANLVYDDDELRAAMSAAGNVYIGAIASFGHDNSDMDRFTDGALAKLETDPLISDAALRESLPEVATHDEAFAAVLRIAGLLRNEFTLTEPVIESRLSKSLGYEPALVRRAYPKAKRLAASRRARRFMDRSPENGLDQFLADAMPGAPPGAHSPDRTALERAWRNERAWRAMADDLPAVSSQTPASLKHAYDVLPPLELLGHAAKGIGLVSYLPDPTDGRLRSVPLVSVVRGRLAPHLGCRIALDVLGVGLSEFADGLDGDGARLTLRSSVDSSGGSLINWTLPPGTRTWTNVFTHVPVTRVLEVALNRETIRDNATRLGWAWAELVELRHAETLDSYRQYVLLVNERLARRAGTVSTPHDGAGSSNRLAVLNQEIAAIQADALIWLRRVHGLWEDATPQNEIERAERDQIERLFEWLAEGRLVERLDRANQRLTERNAALLVELRPLIDGHICLVGYTASAQADLVATPVFERMPGVMAHANVINMMLQRRFVRAAGASVDVLLMLLAGFVVTWNSARRRAVSSFLVALLVGAVFIGIGAVSFRAFGVYVAWLPVLVAAGLAWGSVTVYRQLTEERARRAFERALAQYTSPAVAARIAERADARDFVPRLAEVTCFFSDLQGFTRLSERLGPERTRDVLNPYLQGMSRVLSERAALVNKFIGDGVFAFFNAPVLPCADHARAACEAALAAMADVDLASGVAEEPLVVRIGLATGSVFVGDYGSDTKLDYTCIGDTVNVAARLEQLNKALGTSILVDESCRWAAGEHFAFRNVGLIAVSGRDEAVPVFELRGEVERTSEPTRRFDEAFDRLVSAFQAGNESACRTAVDECRGINPDDRVLHIYAEALERLKGPPHDGWQGVIQPPLD